jgi:DHA1 family bicyclomycin/chloramphenicol resistance-like MFS transporter
LEKKTLTSGDMMGQEKAPPLFLMLLLVCVGSVGAILYTPALPSIAKYYGVSTKATELSMTIYLIGYALGQLPYGPICNRFGRKKALYIGLSIGSCASLVSLLSAHLVNFNLFLFARLLLSLGATAGLQVIYTMVGDIYKPPKSIKIASYLTLTFAIGPSVSTTIGGLLTDWFGWQSCFYFLFIYTTSLLALCRLLPETGVKEPVEWYNLLKNYTAHFQEKKVLYGGLMIGFAICFNYTFSTLAPFIVISQMQKSPSFYGLLNIIPSTSLVIGAFLAAKLATLPPQKTLRLSLFITLLGVLTLIGLSLTPWMNIFLFFIPYAIALFGQPMLETNMICLALHHNKNKAMTSAVLNCLSILLCVFFSLSGRFFKTPTPLNIGIIFLLLTGLIYLCYLKIKKETPMQ